MECAGMETQERASEGERERAHKATAEAQGSS
jgi:hypothetical protein